MNFGVSSAVWLSWMAIFAALELPAVYGKVPWKPLSDWTWQLEGVPKFGQGVQWIVLIGLAVLLVHLVARFPR